MKRLKIAEQILIVLSLALILPLVIAAAIIINTNQIAVRKELISSATILANSFESELNALNEFEKNNMLYFVRAMKKIPSDAQKKILIREIKSNNPNIISINYQKLPHNVIIKNKFSSIYFPEKKEVIFSFADSDNTIVNKNVKIDYIREKIIDNFDSENRQIYIFDNQKNLVLSKGFEQIRFQNILKNYPQKDEKNLQKPILFGEHKNQPNILMYSEAYDWDIVISSPKQLTYYGIIEAKRKILAAICIAAVTVFVLFGFYTLYLYTNIRQFFKVIRAISDGNYMKKLRFLISPFTAQEIIFIADEFNKMIEKIEQSHSELQESNKMLKKLDEYKSNLIDTVSHEFRTPLTSIKGYASSLLRHDINIDAESRKKSLKIIKNQAERLSRMVEDLLVIPDIESATLRMNYAQVNFKNALDTSILSTTTSDISIFNVNIPEDIPFLYCDEDRLIQILINLLENSLKYSKPNTKINISAFEKGNFLDITVHNEAEFINLERLDNLFEKFARVEDNLTRTTRGTGLGLFIVKGIVETMGGEISLSAQNGFDVNFTIPIYRNQDEDIEK